MKLFLLSLTAVFYSICTSTSPLTSFLTSTTDAPGGLNYNSTEDSIKATINKLFTGMKNADAEMVKNCFADSAVMQTISRNKEGALIVRNENPGNFAKSVGSMAKDAADERIVFDVILVDGPLASVWTPYKFYYENKFSHCGVNSFQLVRLNGEWKIQYLIDTRRKAGCSE
jgi:hypothetical protein